jgi:peptidoglycan/LPS O-acetylase OafA/YrhL
MSERHNRNPGLDLLRALAITAVFLGHGITLDRFPILGELHVGVDLFFVLSGFLIGRIYFRASNRQDFVVWHFWRSRWWRTLPPYYAGLGLYVLCRWLGSNQMPPVHAYYLIFLQNYLGDAGFGPSWSLCVEEHFYLALPLLVGLAGALLGRRAFRYLLPIAIFLPAVLRLGTLFRYGALGDQWWFFTHFHFEGLAAGVLLAYWYIDAPDTWRAIRNYALPLALVVPVLMFVIPLRRNSGMVVDSLVYLPYALGFAGCLRLAYDVAPREDIVGRLFGRVSHGIALCSYSLYLTHATIFEFTRLFIRSWPRGVVKSSFDLGVAALAGVIFYFLFERPAIVTRDRFEARRRVVAKGTPLAVAPTEMA